MCLCICLSVHLFDWLYRECKRQCAPHGVNQRAGNDGSSGSDNSRRVVNRSGHHCRCCCYYCCCCFRNFVVIVVNVGSRNCCIRTSASHGSSYADGSSGSRLYVVFLTCFTLVCSSSRCNSRSLAGACLRSLLPLISSVPQPKSSHSPASDQASVIASPSRRTRQARRNVAAAALVVVVVAAAAVGNVSGVDCSA